MLFELFGLLTRDPIRFLQLAPLILIPFALALIFAITIHEFSHALMATVLGDRTAHSQGRLTLNPLSHLEPIGIILLLVAGFGWGRPVPFSLQSIRISPRIGLALVSFAGPASNFVLAAVLAFTIRQNLAPWHPFPALVYDAGSIGAYIVALTVQYNILLGIFNLIPLPPLDGSKILMAFLPWGRAQDDGDSALGRGSVDAIGAAVRTAPYRLAHGMARLEQYGPMVLLVVVMLDNFADTGILSGILGPAMSYALNLMVGRPA